MRRSATLRGIHVKTTRQKYASPSHAAKATFSEDGLMPEIDSASKTVHTPAGPLPISPLMDQSFIEARKRWKAPKPRVTGHKKLRWQGYLERNPYAQALATPSRRCQVTGATMPSFFLQAFNIMGHPESGHPWWVPFNLAPTHPLAGEREPEADPSAPESVSPLERDSASAKSRSPQPPRPTGGNRYTVARQDLLKGFVTKGSGHFNQNKSLTSPRSTPGFSSMTRAVWRRDMDSMVLELMRRRIVGKLLHLSKLCEDHGRRYLQKQESWDDIGQHVNHRGCVLYIKDRQSAGSESGEEKPEAPEASSPGQLALMDVEGVRFGAKLAVHNLDMLLGEDHVDCLRRESSILRQGSIFLLGRQQAMDVQLKLWKLQGYITRNQGKT